MEATPLHASKDGNPGHAFSVAIVTAAEDSGEFRIDRILAGDLQDTMIQRGIDVNDELQNAESATMIFRSFSGGNARAITDMKFHSSSKPGYIVTVLTSGAETKSGMIGGLRSYTLNADSQIRTRDGVLLRTKAFSTTGAGFSESEAHALAASRLAQQISGYVFATLNPDVQH